MIFKKSHKIKCPLEKTVTNNGNFVLGNSALYFLKIIKSSNSCSILKLRNILHDLCETISSVL